VRGTILAAGVAQLSADDGPGLRPGVLVDLDVVLAGVPRLVTTRKQLNLGARPEGEVRGEGDPRQVLPVHIALDAPPTYVLILPARVLQ